MPGFSWEETEKFIDKSLNSIDNDFQTALDILKIDPFSAHIQGAIGGTLTAAVSAVAMSLVSLFFVTQFCTEAMYLRIKTYEDAFKLIFKFFLAKTLVQNATGLMGIIYNSFNKITLNLSAQTGSIIKNFDKTAIAAKPDTPGLVGFNYALERIQAFPTLLIVRAACWTISLVLIGRLFEVIVYGLVAPIPLATVAGEGWTESAKNFLKGYAAVCLQSLIIIVMFNAFNGISAVMAGGTHQLTITITALALALGVIKSGQWARTAVGLG